MPAFNEVLIKENADLLDRVRSHPFMSRLFSEEITDEMLQNWIVHEYLMIHDCQRFVATVAARAPGIIRNHVFEAVINFQGEMETFDELALAKGADKAEVETNLARHALACFQLATAEYCPFEEMISAAYGSFLSILESASVAMKSATAPSKWWGDFPDVNHHGTLVRFVDSLVKSVNKVAETADADRQQAMKDYFRLSLRYVLAYWDSHLQEGQK